MSVQLNLSTAATCFKSVTPRFRQSVGTRPAESNPVFIHTPLFCITLSIPLAASFVRFSFDLDFKIHNLFKVF